ncbi:MAG: cytochrome d ubiquinol oxidase subunit II [Tepidisphaeraceae bacterium]|jgi:cytochrome d ubiquinol oxidase subunit II
MVTLWFCLFWGTLAMFVVSGGTDIGVGILHFLVGRTEQERRQIIRSIDQVWKPNEVWLIVIGGMMFLAFPALLAESLSGFYLAIMLVLWLLIGRGMGIDLRDRIVDPMWSQFWDVVFWLSSILLAVCLGAALGNFVRGVPLDETGGVFFEAFWTNFRLGPDTGILDWFTILVGITAVIALTHHGALWLSHFTDGPVQQRSARLADRLWLVLVIALGVCVLLSTIFQPQVRINLASHPWGVILLLVAGAALVRCKSLRRRGRTLQAYIASGLSLYAVVICTAFGLYPYVLPARNPEYGLTAFKAAAPSESLELALCWWIPAALLVACYFAYVYSKMPSKFPLDAEE